MTKHYDYIAIGGGSGGIASINRAAMYGQKCALIEAKELGGTCVNVGCVPKKVMWHAAQIREAIHMYGPDYGFDTTINKFNWETLIASRTAYIDRIHTSYENVLGKNNVDVIKGFARFVDAKTLEVNGETITAEKLQKTERAEALLFSLGFRDFRVRYFAGAARIQLLEAQLPLALERRTELLSELKKIYPAVLLDLEVRG